MARGNPTRLEDSCFRGNWCLEQMVFDCRRVLEICAVGRKDLLPLSSSIAIDNSRCDIVGDLVADDFVVDTRKPIILNSTSLLLFKRPSIVTASALRSSKQRDAELSMVGKVCVEK